MLPDASGAAVLSDSPAADDAASIVVAGPVCGSWTAKDTLRRLECLGRLLPVPRDWPSICNVSRSELFSESNVALDVTELFEGVGEVGKGTSVCTAGAGLAGLTGSPPRSLGRLSWEEELEERLIEDEWSCL